MEVGGGWVRGGEKWYGCPSPPAVLETVCEVASTASFEGVGPRLWYVNIPCELIHSDLWPIVKVVRPGVTVSTSLYLITQKQLYASKLEVCTCSSIAHQNLFQPLSYTKTDLKYCQLLQDIYSGTSI